ncbi:MAG: glycoside hydrolase family 18 protein, partial [Kiritimatiellae bacterium]|nr:glycoside hydrolase family 18 protein [Kiritimatiellia bacterium]
DNNTNYAARGIQTQAVYYRDASFDQPLIGAKMELNFDSQPFWRIRVQLSEGTDPSILSHFKLYKTSVNYFAPVRATELTGGTLTVSEDGRDLYFDFWNDGSGPHPSVAKGDHLWVTARVAYDAPAAAEIDAKITAVHVNGMVCIVENEDPVGAGRTYEFRRHVVPYYRTYLTNNWNDDYYDVVSEVIFFYMGVNGDGSMYYEYNEDSYRASLERLRDGRGELPVRIMLGIAHCAGGLSQATQNDEARANLVNQIVYYVEKFGFDGVDIDWEYPESNGDWEGFEKLVAELRPRLFELDNGQMVSSAMSNYKLWNNTVNLVGLHQQFDFFNTMTYDQGPVEGQDSFAGHSPWWLHHESKYLTTVVLGLPPIKANIGVPFYVNKHNSSGYIDYNAQVGYDWVYYSHNQYIETIDTFWLGDSMYSYNSIKTIREKGLDLRNNGFGVMIWAYECDIPYDNPKSLARALASVIRPTDETFVEFSEVASAEDWGNMSGNKTYKLTSDLTLTASDYRPVSFTGTLDGQGHTITLKGGLAILGTAFEGTFKNATIVVEGDLNANGAVVNTLQGNGLIENVTVILKDGITISGSNSAGAIIGDIWSAAKGNTACVRNCTAEIHGTITSSGNGRVGGIVGNMNLGDYTLGEGETEAVRIQGCRAELYATAKLIAPAGTPHCGVGGLFGNGNTARECVEDNSVVIYKGAELSAAERVGIVTPGNRWGTQMAGVLNNWALVETGVEEYSLSYADRVMDFTIGEPDRQSKTAMVEYRSRNDGISFRIRQAVQFMNSGYSLRLR